MERVKKIEEIKISEGYVLIKLHMKNSLILVPDMKQEDGGPQLDYAEVLSTGPKVDDITIGDIVLGFGNANTFDWHGSKYAIVARMMIRFFIKPDNFTINGTRKIRSELKN